MNRLRYNNAMQPKPVSRSADGGRLGAKECWLNFPNDVDGDVLRMLEDSGFDFSKTWEIDFRTKWVTGAYSHQTTSLLGA